MTRPNSIIWFERLYLGSMVLGLLNSAFNLTSLSDQVVAATPGAGILPGGFLIGSVIFGFAINLLLWYFVARRGANVARIILTVLFGIGLVGVVMMFFQPLPFAMKAMPIISFVLQAIGVFLLWRPDAKPWFSPNKENLENVFS